MGGATRHKNYVWPLSNHLQQDFDADWGYVEQDVYNFIPILKLNTFQLHLLMIDIEQSFIWYRQCAIHWDKIYIMESFNSLNAPNHLNYWNIILFL